ncbi:MAG TPA: OmpH family outer membrane protein [Acidisphaera sp.]|nr:OmpH family outer membrane protein [Acidisphaera sp.]
MAFLRFLLPVACAAGLLLSAMPGAQAQGWFMPGQGAGGAAHPAPPHPGRPLPAVRGAQPPAPAPMPMPQTEGQQLAPPGAAEPAPPQVQVQLPPPPELSPIPKGTEPPTPRIGVLGVPEVMRASTAAQEIERVLGERRQKLNEEAQKEQAAWRDLQQQLTTARNGLTPDQIRAKERELQERITNAQRSFRDRDRIIQEAAQYSLAQIERTLVAVIRQVAESRGMNLVLHRQQVALNVNEFDLTEQVTQQLNKVLPSVVIPPDGVSPAQMAQNQGKPGQTATAGASPGAAPGGAAPAGGATPASATAPAPPPASGSAPTSAGGASAGGAPGTTTTPPAHPAQPQ